MESESKKAKGQNTTGQMDNDTELPPITEKFEYDAAIGGSCRLETELITFHHGYQHMNEIKALTNAIENPSSTKLVFQKLPKHMRRRAMSHNPNRLPRKHRLAHRAQMNKSGVPAKAKRPSRKHRRKPQNLLAEYQRRQRTNIWLETHIWHAKRFHMINRWGYKLAQSSCDKTFRSSYRASAQHCLIQDISYFGCIELCGTLDVLRNGLDRMTCSELGLGVCAKAYVGGHREGMIELFRVDAYPYGALGRFQFVWQRLREGESLHRLWLFVHPSVYQEIVQELVALFKMKPQTSNKSIINILSPPKYTNETTLVKLIELKDHLNRFRLTGPLSHAVLSAAFKPKASCVSDEKSWFCDYVNNKQTFAVHQSQSKYWQSIKNIKSAAELPPSLVIALNIEDPRINRPKKRTKAISEPVESTDDENTQDILCSIPIFNGDSPIWELTMREKIRADKVSTHEVCVQRNKNVLVPGERCAFENKLQPIPVLLLQRPGSRNPKRLGFGSGWDVIVPPGYGISTWMCLIMWGAKPGALRETETVLREALEEEFLPDTAPAAINCDLLEMELRRSYFHKPPNKRQNYQKLSIASPFKCPWQQLASEWLVATPSGSKFYSLRQRNKLQQIQQCIAGQLKSTALTTIVDENCLIPVSLSMNGRGVANKFSIICLPTKHDLKQNANKLRQFENDPVYTEPIGKDDNEEQRKQMRFKHLKLLKRLRRRRVRVKRKQQEYAERKVIISPPRTAKLIVEQLKAMSELWLPSTPKQCRHQCTREVFGYLTQSQFSFIEAKVAGIGYVTVNGLQKLLKLNSGKGRKLTHVLVRDPSSLHYRLATLSIRC